MSLPGRVRTTYARAIRCHTVKTCLRSHVGPRGVNHLTSLLCAPKIQFTSYEFISCEFMPPCMRKCRPKHIAIKSTSPISRATAHAEHQRPLFERDRMQTYHARHCVIRVWSSLVSLDVANGCWGCKLLHVQAWVRESCGKHVQKTTMHRTKRTRLL